MKCILFASHMNKASLSILEKKFMGSIAAPFVMVYWGSVHAILQNIAAIVITVRINGKGGTTKNTIDIEDLRASFRDLFSRRLVLSMGLILPLTALSVFFVNPPLQEDFPKKEERYMFFPALYWEGNRGAHVTSVYFAGWGGFAMLPIFLAYTILILLRIAERPFRIVTTFLQPSIALMQSFFASIGSLLNNSRPISIMVLRLRTFLLRFRCFLFILFILKWCLFGLLSLCGLLVVYFMGIGIMGFFCIPPFGVLRYLFNILARRKVSESCFFMPCAPQSIHDRLQALSLRVGLIGLVFRAIPPCVRKVVQLWGGQVS